jgi:hypothetical protein
LKNANVGAQGYDCFSGEPGGGDERPFVADSRRSLFDPKVVVGRAEKQTFNRDTVRRCLATACATHRLPSAASVNPLAPLAPPSSACLRPTIEVRDAHARPEHSNDAP